jgi:hypothetical protein
LRVTTALALKLALQGLVLLTLLPALLRASVGVAMLAAAILWLASFLIGDLVVLAWMGQAPAAATDFLLAVASLSLLLRARLGWAEVAVAAAVTIEEAFFHRFLVTRGVVGQPALRRRSGR